MWRVVQSPGIRYRSDVVAVQRDTDPRILARRRARDAFLNGIHTLLMGAGRKGAGRGKGGRWDEGVYEDCEVGDKRFLGSTKNLVEI